MPFKQEMTGSQFHGAREVTSCIAGESKIRLRGIEADRYQALTGKCRIKSEISRHRRLHRQLAATLDVDSTGPDTPVGQHQRFLQGQERVIF